jgi:DNA mismatch repair protein MutL
LEIFSRSAIVNEGWRVVYDSQGQAAQVKTVAIAPGTVVTVSNLFAAWAERRQGMPSVHFTTNEMRVTLRKPHKLQFKQKIALCH